MNIFVPPGANKLWPRPQTAEPFLYITVWLAVLSTLITDYFSPGPFWSDIGLTGGLGYGWTILMLLSPIQIMVAWFLIHCNPNRFALPGMWHRLGGNTGLFLGLLAYVLARLKFHGFPPPDAAMFGHMIVSGVALFVLSLVVRDIISLIMVESIVHASVQLKGE